jgi:O-antigen/teichoic acid export membrane protein
VNRPLARDVWWNIASLAVAGAFGILLNQLVALAYGKDALGVFNQVWAVYIVFSQLAALGCHYSVLKHIAASDDDSERRAIATSGLVSALLLGALFATVAWAIARPIGDLVDSVDVGRGIRYMAPGILFFALSKVTLAALNGLHRMRWYAILFAARIVLMVAGFGVCVALDVHRATLPVILTVAESIVFLASLVPLRRALGRIPGVELRRWLDLHLRFGSKGFASGMLAELNTRVDVLILGYFATDAVVGAYSYAAILAEGVFQLVVALRTTFAPIVIRLWAEGRADELAATIRRTRDRVYLASVPIGVAAVAAYWLLVPFATSDPALVDSWRYFGVLIAGIVATAGYGPFQPILLYAGLPGWHTVLMLVIVLANAIANVVLIAAFGAIGSALGTGLAVVGGVVTLRVLARRLLGVAI